MPILVLLNGGPAAGKSTLARAWAEDVPLALVLDVDVVRSMLGSWQRDPGTAGRAARTLALGAARTHLSAGHDVVVPQLLMRPELADALRELAHEVGADHVEVCLTVDPAVAAARYRLRDPVMPDVVVHAADADVPAMVARVAELAASREGTRYVPAPTGDGLAALSRFRAVVEAARTTPS